MKKPGERTHIPKIVIPLWIYLLLDVIEKPQGSQKDMAIKHGVTTDTISHYTIALIHGGFITQKTLRWKIITPDQADKLLLFLQPVRSLISLLEIISKSR